MTTPHDTERGRPPGLLVLDPDPHQCDALASGMRGHGWRVWTAAEGTVAIDLYRRYHDQIDVALVDLQLPDLQGAQVLAELGRLDSALTRCAMSADVTPYSASAFRRLSVTPLFAKPVHAPALSFALHEMIAAAVRS